jgi:AMIN domain
MIRVNLLRNRKEGLQRLMAEPGRGSSFISRREVLLAGLFLVLGGAILWFVLGEQMSLDRAVTAGNAKSVARLSDDDVSGGAAADGVPSVVPASGPPTMLPAAPAVTPPAAPLPAGSAAPTSEPPNSTAKDSPLVSSATHVSPATAEPTAPSTPAPLRGSTLLAERATAQAASTPPHQVAPSGPRSGSGGAITMSALRILGQGDALQILAATDGQPEYKMFRVDNPDRVVIDMAGVRQEIPREGREQRLSNSIVTTVRVAQNQIDPPMVRLVLEVKSFPELQILARPDGLLINITGR